MNTEILGVVAQIALMVILAYPLGKYMLSGFSGEWYCWFRRDGCL